MDNEGEFYPSIAINWNFTGGLQSLIKSWRFEDISESSQSQSSLLFVSLYWQSLRDKKFLQQLKPSGNTWFGKNVNLVSLEKSNKNGWEVL